MIYKDEVTVVIPTLNEEQAISDVIKEVKDCGYKNIMVVDGYSTDKTVSIAKTNGIKVISQHGKGKTSAIKTALESVETEYMLVLDGDSTYDPKDGELFLNHMNSYDEIIGVRTKGKENIPKFNRLGNWLITKTFNILLGANLSDVCSGMYMLRTETAKKLELNTRGFDVEVEIAAQMVTNHKITEVPISYRERKGEQKLSSVKHGPQIVASVLRMANNNNPIFLFSGIASLLLIPGLALLLWSFFDLVLFGFYHEFYTTAGIILSVLASQALTVSAISLLLKRMEKRLSKKIRE